MRQFMVRIVPLALLGALVVGAPAAHATPPVATATLNIAGDALGDSSIASELGVLYAASFDEVMPEACDTAQRLVGYGMNVDTSKFCYNPDTDYFTPNLSVDTLCRSSLTPASPATIVNVVVASTSAWTLDSAGVARGCDYPTFTLKDVQKYGSTYKKTLGDYVKNGYKDNIKALDSCDELLISNENACQVLDSKTGEYVFNPSILKQISAPPAPAAPTAVALSQTGVLSMAANASSVTFLKTDGTVVNACDATLPAADKAVCKLPSAIKSGVVKLAASGSHTIALINDGSVADWGVTAAGAPTPPATKSAVDVAAGDDFGLALMADGTVSAWGDSSQGQTDVPSGLSGATAVAAGSCFAAALKSDGTIAAWGCGASGAAGLSDVTNASAIQAIDGSLFIWMSDGTTKAINVAATRSSVTQLYSAMLPTMASGGGSYWDDSANCTSSKSETMFAPASGALSLGAPTAASTSSSVDGDTAWTYTWSEPTNSADYEGVTYQTRYSAENGLPGTWSDWEDAESGMMYDKPTNGAVARFEVRAVTDSKASVATQVTTQEVRLCGGAQVSDVSLTVSRSAAAAPGAASLISTSSTTPRAMRVAFAPTAVNNGSPITGYTLRYSSNGTSWTSVTMRGYVTTLSPIAPGTNWQLQVVSTNGVGSTTATSTGKTIGEATVSGLTATTTNARSVTLSWTLNMPSDNAKDKVSDYLVEYSANGGDWVTFDHKASSKTTLEVTGLICVTPYHFRVSAVAISGTASPSSPLSVTTKPDVPSIVNGLTLAWRDTTSVSASWSAPDTNGGATVSGYNVTASNKSATASVSGTTAVISGLTAGKEVTISVSAKNSAGNGPAASSKILVVGRSDAVTITAVRGVTSATFSWKAPKATGGLPIDSYKVTASAGSVSVTGNSATVTGLSNGQATTLTVVPVTGFGDGASASLASSALGLPGAVTSLASADKKTNWGLTWTAPADNGGSKVTAYEVSISTDGGKTYGTPETVSKAAYTLVKSLGSTRYVMVKAVNAAGSGTAATLKIVG